MKVGDEVTGIDANGDIRCGTVTVVDPPQHEFVWTARTKVLTLSKLHDEGVTWISGWYTLGSIEAQALLAAWKLRPPRAMPLEEASALYQSGAMSFDAWKENLDRWDAELVDEPRR